MADIKKVLEIEVDTDTGSITKTLKELNKNIEMLADAMFEVSSSASSVKGELEETNQELKKSSKEAENLNKKTKEVDKSTKKSKKGTIGLAGAWKKVGTAIKAAGIGLVIGIIAKLGDLLRQNQVSADGFSTAMNFLSIAFNDFFSFISDNIGTVIEYYKSVFEDPQTALQNFGKRIKEEVLNRFKQMAESAGFLGRALKKLFSGDFSGAWDDAKEAARQAVDIITGEDGGIEAITSGFNRAVGAIKEYTKETFAQAEALTNAAAATQFLEVESRRLQLQYQKQAEELRQIRDDERNTIQERIEANRQLGELLVESAEVEKGAVQQRINNLEREQEILGYNRDRQIEIQNLKVEQLDIDERIAGFRSEQLTNENSLLREQTDLIREQDALRIELMEDGIDKELMASAAKYDELYRQAEGNKELQLAITEAQEREAGEIQEKYRQKELDAEKAKAAAKQQLAHESAALATDLLVEFASFTDSESKRGFQIQKAASLAQATTSTVLAAIEAFKTAAASPITIGFPAYPFTQAAAAAAFGAVNIAKIASAQYKGGGGGASSGGASRGGGQSAPAVNFNTVGGSGINQLNESIVAQNNTVKAYVVSSEVSSAQSLDRNRQSNATFG